MRNVSKNSLWEEEAILFLLFSALISRFVISQRKVIRLALLNGKIFRAGMNLGNDQKLKDQRDQVTCHDLIANLFPS